MGTGSGIDRELQKIRKLMALVYIWFFISLLTLGYLLLRNQFPDRGHPVSVVEEKSSATDMDTAVADGIHLQTGMIYDTGFEEVRRSCTGCHSPKLITQNRADREGWKNLITWMQETQGLWELGKDESIILDYLAKNYAPEEVGRRPQLDPEEIEWYILEL